MGHRGTADGAERVEELLAQLTLAEQVSLLAGADFWTTVVIPRLGIPALKVTDGDGHIHPLLPH